MPTLRVTYLAIFLVALILIAVALYMQYVMELMPCALCITQRVFIIAIGIIGLVAAIQNPRGWGRWVYGGLGVLSAAVGAAVAGRQLWLQSLPPEQAPACGPSIDYVLETFPLREALSILLRGDGNCAEVMWTFLGLSIPGWTLIAFLGFAAVFLWQALRRPV
jgi:disulfide bond formation protein DsbB